MSRGNSIGASMPKGVCTVTQLANLVGVSPETIRRWADAGHLTPKNKPYGSLEVRTFDRAQVKRAKELAGQTSFIENRRVKPSKKRDRSSHGRVVRGRKMDVSTSE